VGDVVRRTEYDTEQLYLVARLALAAAGTIAEIIIV
jgi:hypothetical protein